MKFFWVSQRHGPFHSAPGIEMNETLNKISEAQKVRNINVSTYLLFPNLNIFPK